MRTKKHTDKFGTLSSCSAKSLGSSATSWRKIFGTLSSCSAKSLGSSATSWRKTFGTLQQGTSRTDARSCVLRNAALLCLFLLFFSCSEQQKSIKLVTVEQKEVQKSLSFRGRVVPRGKELAQSLSKGEILFLAEHGKTVQAGELIFEMNTEKISEDIQNIEQDISTQQFLLRVQEKKLQLIKVEEKQTSLLKKEELKHAKFALKEKEQKATKDERKILALQLEKQKMNRLRSREDLERQEQLLEKNFVTHTHLDSYRARHKTTEERFKELQIQQRIKLEPISEEQRLELQSDIERRQSELKRSQEALKRRREESLYESKVVEDKIAELKHRLDYKKSLLSKSTYRAKEAGIFLRRQYRDWRGGGRFKHYSIGQEVNARDVIGEIIQSHSPFIEVLLSEAEVNSLAQNMKAKIELAALPGIAAHGQIRHIGFVGQDRNDVLQEGTKQAKISSYRAEIVLKKNENIKLRNGMSAIVHFSSAKSPQLIIPRSALIIESQQKSVLDEKGQKILVEGEVIDDFFFAVHSGLQEGQKIQIVEED